MDIHWTVFYVLLMVCIPLYVYARRVVEVSEDVAFKSFQTTYLLVYLLAAGSDWLQGPFVYALYQDYGMTVYEIDMLFVTGFVASMSLGTYVGSSADKLGRRKICIIYGILYILSCVIMHVPVFLVLLSGRVLAGVANSLLFTSLESWAVCEHHKRGFSEQLLGVLFSHAVQVNSLIAISTGHLAHVFANSYGFAAPFDLSLCILLVMIILISFTWKENYGDPDASIHSTFSAALKIIRNDKKVFLLGLSQAFFEGAMYTFILKWTPALTPVDDHDIFQLYSSNSHTLIFTSFMVAIMIGSILFKLLSRVATIQSFMRFVLLVAACSLAIPVFVPQGSSCILFGFCQFEICVGIFWPSLGTLRGIYIPESVRATTMNIFRIPLNVIVVVILTQEFDTHFVFLCCTVFLIISFLAQHRLYKYLLTESSRKAKASTDECSDFLDKRNIIINAKPHISIA